MTSFLRILFLEDDPEDVRLVHALLEADQIASEITRVETRAEFLAFLQKCDFDLILADYTLPSFDGISALDLARNVRPNVPFIFVSGTLGEEVAIDALKTGATDYVLKAGLVRLAPAVRRALKEEKERAKHKETEVALRLGKIALAEQESIARTLREQAKLLDLTHDAIFVHDMSGVITYWNRGASVLYGWTADEARGKTAPNLLNTQSPPPLELREGHWQGELVRTRRNGLQVIVAARWSLQRDDQGEPIAILETSNDITEHKRAEAAMRESEQRYRTLFEKANDAIFLENKREEIIEVNQQACELLGYSREELLTMKASDLQAPEVRRPAGSTIGGEIERYGDATFETVDLHRSGRRIAVEVSRTTILDRGHELVLSVVRDISERQRAAEALQQMHEQLAHANRVATMGQLTASIAHEIAQPIGAVYNRANAAINFLNQDPPDLEEVREAISRIADAADRAGEIIGRIRDQVKKAPPRRDILDLNEAIEEVLLLAANAITKDAIVVQADFENGLPPVQGDRVQLQQVALNLILNAVEAMRSVDDHLRKLQISTKQNEAGIVLVAVCDTGPGIAPENLERVFESFFTTKSSGVGIGLSICRSILKAHGGSLWASANEPRGARFQFTLPGAAAYR